MQKPTHFSLPYLLLSFIPLSLLLAACSSNNPPLPAPSGMPGEPPRSLKISIADEGMYEVTSADLRAFLPSPAELDPTAMRLFNRGLEQPLWVQGEGENLRLRFYAQPTDSRYLRQNVYILELYAAASEPPRRIQLQQPAAADPLPAVAIYATTHSEQNLLYAPQVQTGEHLFWQILPAPAKQSFEVSLNQLASGEASLTASGKTSLTVEVWASTSAQNDPDHHVLLRVNGQPALDESWDGMGRRTLTAALPAGLLAPGLNTVEIEIPGDTGAPAEILFVDWIEIRYPREAAAADDALLFDAGTGIVTLTGFSGSVQVLDVTEPGGSLLITPTLPGGGEAVFPAEAGRRYAALGPQGYRSPANISVVAVSPDLRAIPGAEYLAIGAADLLPAVQPLIDFHNQRGLASAAIPLEAIVDQFNGGLAEPEAIRAFLRYAVQNWPVKPRYVLLVGDSTYDPQGYISTPEANRLPAFFILTEYGGETVSDVSFALLDDDALPDVAVSRVPAQTTAELGIWVQKTLAYEQQPQTEWSHRVLAIADGQEASFSSEAQVFLDLFTGQFSGTLYAPEAGVSGAAQQISTYFQEGFGLVAYFGHGSVNMWGKDKLFTTDDVAALANGAHLPVVINMNCLTGLFTHPKVISLAETLLWKSGGGAVAVLAPSSLTLPTDQSFLSKYFVEALNADPTARLGDWYLQAQRQMPVENPGVNEVMLTFLLFGDPALQLIRSGE